MRAKPKITVCPLPHNVGASQPKTYTFNFATDNGQIFRIPGPGLMIKIGDNHTITVQKAVKKLEFILIETE